jgi:hypothetical protein
MYPMAAGRNPLANTRQAQYALIRSRAHYRQIVHQTTHSLARFFLELDANYKQFQTATRMRKAAAQRLDAQRAYYEEGRITIDRFLDAVGQYTTAVATEAQYQTAYNISILALEEAKGTLLAHDNIVVAEGPRPRKPLPQAVKTRDVVKADGTVESTWPAAPVKTAPAQPATADRANGIPSKPDKTVTTASFEVEKPKEVKVPPAGVGCPSEAAKTATMPKGKTWTFSFSIGGADPLQIEGTITSSEGAPPQGGD